MPKRVQLKRTAGYRKPAGAVVITRPGLYGNPYPVGMRLGDMPFEVVRQSGLWGLRPNIKINGAMAVALFRAHLELYPEAAKLARNLRGRDVACWCELSKPCHGDVWLEYANKEE